MDDLTRRELLGRLSLLLAAGALGCRRTDWFGEERVCIHILDPRGAVPEPLLERLSKPSASVLKPAPFRIGIPELIVASTTEPLLGLFPYFWPLTREEFDQLHGKIRIEFAKPRLEGASDLEVLRVRLRALGSAAESSQPSSGPDLSEPESPEPEFPEPRSPEPSLAVLLTYNDRTRYWTSEVVEACREAPVREIVIFKDPTKPPYLCDYPALQKGFRRPPP